MPIYWIGLNIQVIFIIYLFIYLFIVFVDYGITILESNASES